MEYKKPNLKIVEFGVEKEIIVTSPFLDNLGGGDGTGENETLPI